jgi:Skp family chaperone for outer membrane proteins
MKRGLLAVLVAAAVLALAFPGCASSTEERLSALEDQVASLTSEVELLTFTTTNALQKVANLESEIADLKAQLTDLRKGGGASLRVAYINAEDAFTVFTDVVQDLRHKALEKQQQIASLQQDVRAGKIAEDVYQRQNTLLQVQLLQAQLAIDIGTIDKLISAPGFSDMRSDLQKLKTQAQPVVDEVQNLVWTVQTGAVDPTDFQSRYTQLKNAFTQLDQLLTQAATSKIIHAAQQVAVDNGYDLVLRVKNVIVYRNTMKLVDITDLVKHELSSYLP